MGFRSILPWVGGKSNLKSILLENIPEKFNDYYEPFIGGGTLLFALTPLKAKVNDINPWLILVYLSIKFYPTMFINKVLVINEEIMRERNKIECYEKILKKFNKMVKKTDLPSDLSKISKEAFKKYVLIASTFYFLIKRSYGGHMWYDENSDVKCRLGQSQLRERSVLNRDLLLDVSDWLQNSDIKFCYGDYKNLLKTCKKGDFIYLDPPYYKTDVNIIAKYSNTPFTEKDQIELSKIFAKLDKKGCYVMLSNSNHENIEKWYKGFNITELKVRRPLYNKYVSGKKNNELLIKNY